MLFVREYIAPRLNRLYRARRFASAATDASATCHDSNQQCSTNGYSDVPGNIKPGNNDHKASKSAHNAAIGHEAEVAELHNICNSGLSAEKSLSIDEIRRVSSNFQKLRRKGVVDADLCEKYSSLLLNYAEGSVSKPRITPNECFELFMSQFETNSPRHISLLASRLLDCIKADGTNASIALAIRALVRLQQAKISFPEMLEYVANNVEAMSPVQLADFTWICYSGGLRSKHHLDIAYKACLHRLHEFDFADLLRVMRSLSYFSYEYREAFKASWELCRDKLQCLRNDDLLMLLNICKTLHKEQHSLSMRDTILEHIMNDMMNYPTKFGLQCLGHLTRGVRTKVAGKFILDVLSDTSECRKEFEQMPVSALVSIMQCIEFWRIRMGQLTIILDIMADRISELAYSRNLGLWADVYNVIYSTGWFNVKFMRAGVEHILSETQILHRVSSHQVIRVLQAFYKLRYYHRESYERMLQVFLDDFDAIKVKLNVVCEALLAAADANIEMPALYERCIEHLSEKFQGFQLVNDDLLQEMECSYLWPRNVITSAWALAVMGYNSDPRFKVFLELLKTQAIFEQPQQTSIVLMALEVAESTLVSGHHLELSETILDIYGNRLREMERAEPELNLQDVDPNDSMRDHVDERMTFAQCQEAHFHKGRMRATKHISDILYHLGRRDVLVRVAPHYNSPYLIDVCLSNESKKGLVLFSGRELMRNHEDGKWSIVDTGSTRLKRYILAKTGWKVYEISCGHWAMLQTPLERKEYIRTALAALDIEL